jgi:Zn-dependent protease
MLLNNTLVTICVTLLIIFVSTAVHEMMHAYVALRLGDDMAYLHGRISLNPIRHIDPFLTVLLPLGLMLLGMQPILAAKPVPINVNRVRGGEMGLALIGIAGPLTNLVLAVLAAGILRFTVIDGFALYFATRFFFMNVGLFVFNMMPLPPLDGSRLLYAFAPEPVQRVMEQVESFGVMGVILFVSILSPWLGPILSGINNGVARVLIGY